MLVSPRLSRARPRVPLLGALVLGVILWSLLSHYATTARLTNRSSIRHRFPLAWKHIQKVDQLGGAWHIPPSWLGDHDEPRNIMDAVKLASEAAAQADQRQIPYSNIPLIVHQKWNDNDLAGLNDQLITYVERWLAYSLSVNDTSREMAYFWWADSGVAMLVKEKEKDFIDDYLQLFSRVERVDIFRILVCKWFGGIYGDVDTEPLKHPADWIQESDLSAWTDEETGQSYGTELPAVKQVDNETQQVRPVNLLWGIEADTDPKSDQYWRMGYNYPVQLTNWAMASARQHPVLTRFMDQLRDKVQAEKLERLKTPSGQPLRKHDPLTRTGPAAVTLATMSWLKRQVGLRWNALTGLKDGGRAKLAFDVLVLPITGFSPGRGKLGNMGSKPYTDADARLAHHAMGSWHKFSITVETGKLCRTLLGMCREWSKVPS